MAKNPVLPLYYNDILGSTKTWTDEEFGAYVRLLIEQWDKGGLPNDYQRLTRLCTSLPTNWDMLRSKFPEADGLLKNPVMEAIREKRAKHSEKQSENVRKRYQTSTKPPTKNLPLEIENEIENEKVIEGKEVQEENQLEPAAAFDEIYIENLKLSRAYPGVDIDQELKRFILKVQGSPNVYAEHGTDGLRLAFNAQLRSVRPSNGEAKKPRQKAFEL